MRAAALGVLLLALACGPKPRAATPRGAAEPASAIEVSSGVRVARDVVIDESNGWRTFVPAGWTASARFRADASGPPAIGDLRARFEDRIAGCVIDIAIEPAFDAREVVRGRELFYLAESDAPKPPGLPIGRVFTATFVPPDPSRLDVGYWLELDDARWLRVEGRFSLASNVGCKTKLDEIVRSLSRTGPHENFPAASRAP